MLQLGIFLFKNVEVLDFAGPFEVFSVASQLSGYKILHVSTFGENENPIRTVNGLQVIPDYGLENSPKFHFLVIPGGDGSKQVIQNPALMDSLQEKIKASKWTMSVCSGSRILGKLDFLDGLKYCTHHQVYDDMSKIVPTGFPQPKERFTQSSNQIYTAAGISAGIDLSLFLLETTFGKELAKETAQYMEYLPYLNQL
jgi:transcriptional regulator GlxA family with amidase domain